MASVRFRNGRFEARVRVEGKNFSKSFDALDEARKWALGLEVGAIRPPARRGKPSPAMTFIGFSADSAKSAKTLALVFSGWYSVDSATSYGLRPRAAHTESFFQ